MIIYYITVMVIYDLVVEEYRFKKVVQFKYL